MCYNKINDIKKLEFLALAFYVTNSSKYLLFLSNYQQSNLEFLLG